MDRHGKPTIPAPMTMFMGRHGRPYSLEHDSARDVLSNESLDLDDGCDSSKVYNDIEDSFSSPYYFKEPAPWGFVTYRTSYSNEEAWKRMVQKIQDILEMEESFSEKQQQQKNRVLSHHDLVLMNNKEQFNSATTHDVRDHFCAWVAEELPKRVLKPDELDCEAIRRNDNREDSKSWPHLIGYGTRYSFCLMVDDICLESLDHMRDPVVKLVARDFGHLEPAEREYTVHPGWEDGETDEDYEYVGWAYMEIIDYLDQYASLLDEASWPDPSYIRPPYLMGRYDATDEIPGFWRK